MREINWKKLVPDFSDISEYIFWQDSCLVIRFNTKTPKFNGDTTGCHFSHALHSAAKMFMSYYELKPCKEIEMVFIRLQEAAFYCNRNRIKRSCPLLDTSEDVTFCGGVLYIDSSSKEFLSNFLECFEFIGDGFKDTYLGVNVFKFKIYEAQRWLILHLKNEVDNCKD